MHAFVDDLRHNYFVSAVITIVIGIVMVVRPEISGRLICYILGAALIVMGIIQWIVYLRGQRLGLISKFSMLMGLVLVLLGVWVCVRPDSILALIPVVIGILLLLHGLMDIQYAVDIKNAGAGKWWIALIGALITLVIGVFLVMHPFLAFEITMSMIGIGLLYDGISDLALIAIAWYTRKQYDKQIKAFAQGVEDEK